VCIIATPCADGYLDDPAWALQSDQVVVRSTVLPAAFDALRVGRRHHWPEFLTEATADADVLAPDKLVWGTDDETDVSLLVQLLGGHYWRLRDRAVITTLRASAVAKLGINAIYTAKVLLHNALWDAVDHDEGEYGALLAAEGHDKRLLVSHSDPWHGGYRGAGGKCLPKDTAILAAHLGETWAGDLMRDLLDRNAKLRADT
jgi:UDPglucose 6-dehydrogenase